ncbi:AraC family transcriptional regulator [Lactococcus hodotermopsidis]|uniref:AraC family transcriptional regulator n=2 Tax=Pseudolactococcus hodotermopsidis TaxID=2709157 RepID=A0A6A0B842_9LACT|nr:AraC family transcriptional regulator [Lactococcus hodotermopsidis]
MVEHCTREHPFAMTYNHSHKESEIYLLLEGSGELFLNSAVYPLNAGSLVLIDKDQVHKTNMMKCNHHERILIEFDTSYFESAISGASGISLQKFFNGFFGVIQLDDEMFPLIKQLLLAINKEVATKSFKHHSMLVLLMTQFVILTMRYVEQNPCAYTCPSKKEATHRITTEAIAYIKQNLQNELSLDSISHEVFVNKSYLCRIFKATTGLSVHDYINNERIKIAKSLLATSDDSIETISGKCGYSNKSYFERVFKKHMEISPYKYRKHLKLSQDTARRINHNDNFYKM